MFAGRKKSTLRNEYQEVRYLRKQVARAVKMQESAWRDGAIAEYKRQLVGARTANRRRVLESRIAGWESRIASL